jgi:error-prone DNA polymerase
MRGKPWQSLHPLLHQVLDETYGTAIYQEQITQMAMALADFSPFDGDQLRKIVSKKHKAKKLEDYRRRFFAGGMNNGVTTKVLEAAWEQILSFAGYSFCKPHSASYALVSCKAAWLKANHPAEFMAAVISNQGGYYTPLAYLSECRRLGLHILPPDINASTAHYTGREGEVRVGLMQLQGLTRSARDTLLRARQEGGAFRTFGDFLRRAPLAPADTRLLIKAGCFDTLEGRDRRPALLWEMLRFHGDRPADGSGFLFESPVTDLPHPVSYDEPAMLRQEVETLGLLVSRHPLTLYRQATARAGAIAAVDLPRFTGRHVTVAGWWVTGKTVQTRLGQPMEFVSFEDTSAIFDATFFPRVYARFCRMLARQRPYLLKGKVDEEFGVTTLTVEWVGFLEEE